MSTPPPPHNTLETLALWHEYYASLGMLKEDYTPREGEPLLDEVARAMYCLERARVLSLKKMGAHAEEKEDDDDSSSSSSSEEDQPEKKKGKFSDDSDSDSD